MKKALIVGINYVGTPSELRGCINDANNMRELLEAELGFEEFKMVLEKDATTQGIMDGLRWLVAGAVPGDVLFFHYSGHGSQIRSNIEPDGLDEIICPIDLNWRDKVIRDDDMKAVLNTVPNGVNLTVFLDCCNSGTALDQEGSLYEATKVQLHQEKPLVEAGGRFMPMPAEVEQYIAEEGLEIRQFVTSRDINRSALLIAACASHQTSADAFLEGQFQGAATCSLRQALKAGKDTYRDIADFMTAFMTKGGFTQRPQLDGHPSLYDQVFLEPWGTLFGTPTQTPAPGTWTPPVEAPAPAPAVVPAPAPAVEDTKTDMSTLLAIGAVILAIIVYAFVS